jgi:hypothetical protein
MKFKLAQSVRTGAWLLIGLNLLMALGSIWIFDQMAPNIERIIAQNGRSLQACDTMLSALAHFLATPDQKDACKSHFEEGLQIAKSNLTETGEETIIAAIENHYLKAFESNPSSVADTLEAIKNLRTLNWNATLRADQNAKKFGKTGAWAVVFMAVLVFWAGVLFKQFIFRTLVTPMEEIHSVMTERRRGDRYRRCSGRTLPQEIQSLYRQVNDLLDS